MSARWEAATPHRCPCTTYFFFVFFAFFFAIRASPPSVRRWSARPGRVP